MSKKLGNTLCYLRKEMSLTQKSISDRLGVDRSTYSNYERGITEPDSGRIRILADIFGVSVDYLLSGENEMNKVADVKPKKSRLKNQVGLLTKDEQQALLRYRLLSTEDKEEIKKEMEEILEKKGKNEKSEK